MTRPLLLLVDDDAALCAIATHLGRRFGHEVVCHADVETAWQFLNEHRPDLDLSHAHFKKSDDLAAVLCRRR